MRSGLLTEQIKLYTPITSGNSYGEEEITYQFSYETRARLVHDGGTRHIENGEVVLTHSKTFQVRIYVPVGEFDIVEWENKRYRILNVEPDKAQQLKTIKTELIND